MSESDGPDKSVCTPQNDLDCYFNHEWKKKNSKYLKYKSTINNFLILQEEIDDSLIDFVLKAGFGKNNIQDNLVRFRQSYFQRKATHNNISLLIEKIQDIKSIHDLANIIKILNRNGIYSLFDIGVVSHHREPDTYTFYIGEMNLSLDNANEYSSDNKDRIHIFENSLANIYDFITAKWNYSMSSSKLFVQHVIVFEIIVSKITLDLKDSHNPKIINNSKIYPDFLDTFDYNNFWQIILNEYCDENTYISYPNVEQLIMIKFILKNMNEDDLAMIKDFLVYCVVKKYGLFTDMLQALSNISYENTTEKTIFSELIYETFGYYLQTIYEQENYNPKKHAEIYSMFERMKSYCKMYFAQTNMFSRSTIDEAIKKLDYLDIIIGASEYFVDLSGLPKLEYNFYDNYSIISSFYFEKSMNLIGKKINRRYISINNDVFSFILNAYYDPRANIIFVPTSIITDIFFDVNAPPLYNYGGLGSIIGHEMMHCFDNSGSQYDEVGHLRNWWTPYDYQKFNTEVDKVRQHYSKLSVNGTKINADVSTGENMADISGLKLSLRTYLLNYYPNNFYNGRLHNLNQKQKNDLKLFFERWAKIFRSVLRQSTQEYLLKNDVHAPDNIRINAPFSHLDEYYIIFDVKPTDKNYLAPDLRTKFLDWN